MNEWKEVTARITYAKLEVGVETYRIGSAYGPRMEKTREEREALWFELWEVLAGRESDEWCV